MCCREYDTDFEDNCPSCGWDENDTPVPHKDILQKAIDSLR